MREEGRVVTVEGGTTDGFLQEGKLSAEEEGDGVGEAGGWSARALQPTPQTCSDSRRVPRSSGGRNPMLGCAQSGSCFAWGWLPFCGVLT